MTTVTTHDPLTLEVLEGNIRLLADKERLELDKSKLEEIGRLKTEYLAKVSHDLRTPLNSIIGFSDLLMADAGGELAKKHVDLVAAILRNGQSLLCLINDLLDLASLESGRLTLRRDRVALTTLLDDLRAATEPTLTAAKLTVVWPDPGSLAGQSAAVDRRRLLQALVNLVDNARKYTPPGGRVLVTMQADGDGATFVVSDTGPGIPEEDRERVFTSFVQRPLPGRQPSGVGLGLAIVRGIAELHGGSIDLDSGPQGSRFTLRCPTARE